jgi:hypothetical protein
MPHASPISLFSILPPAQYWVRNTDHSAVCDFEHSWPRIVQIFLNLTQINFKSISRKLKKYLFVKHHRMSTRLWRWNRNNVPKRRVLNTTRYPLVYEGRTDTVFRNVGY